MIIISYEVEKKYLLNQSTFNNLLKSKKHSKVGIIQWYVSDSEDTRYRLTIKKLPTGFYQEWTYTSKSSGLEEREEIERSVSPQEIAEKWNLLKSFKMVAKIRYILQKNPEIVIDEFLKPFEHQLAVKDLEYLMEVEEKGEVKKKDFNEYLKDNDYPVENFIEVNDNFEKYKNKNLATKFEVKDKSVFDIIEFVKNRLKGDITLVITQGRSLTANGKKNEYEQVYTELEELFIKEEYDKIKFFEIPFGISAEIDTYDLIKNMGYKIINIVLFTQPDFFGQPNSKSKDIKKIGKSHTYYDENNSWEGAMLKCIFEKKYNLNVEIAPLKNVLSRDLFDLSWSKLDEVLSKNSKDQFIIDVTGGQKNVGLVIAIYSLFKNIPFYYKYEKTNLEEFPAFGLDWDYDYFDNIYSIVKTLNLNENDKILDIKDFLNLPEEIANVFSFIDSYQLKPFYPLARILSDYEEKRELPFGIGKNLLDVFEVDDGNKEKTRELKEYIENMIITKWSKQWIGDLIPETVEHSQRHSKRLMDFTASLINILSEEKFLPEDISDGYYGDTGIKYKYVFYFILILALNVHDLGHTYSKFKLNDGNFVYLDKYPSLVRDLHNELSVQFIDEYKNEDSIFNIFEPIGENDVDLKKLFGNKKEEILEAVKLISKYHRGYLPIDKDRESKSKEYVQIFGIDTTPLKELLESGRSPIKDEELKKLVIHAARWLKFIDGTDVQADRIVTNSYHSARLKRTKFEILSLIDKYELNFPNSVNLKTLKELVKKVSVGPLDTANANEQRKLFADIKDKSQALETQVYEYIKKQISNGNYSINNPEMELLDTIAFKSLQFEHFEKHRNIAAIYPLWLEWYNDEDAQEIYLHLNLIKNVANNDDTEFKDKVIEEIKKDIKGELEGANLRIMGKILKLSFDKKAVRSYD
ncbi:hypothetical protein HWHPT5561_09400 [Petrotoga sp. HWH.PT.55.6.1]|uniref:hypothetical protein n=1 Tax=unclassified Petrotoga TaxID=2620614 RepID=UPI000C9FFD59|nr:MULTISPECIES: hypothetical protein [unclassified Petrotoga]PNR87489.1 hypothetical protein X925_08990 [Petrotoga sp. 9T1HF07.CasAA.8.2]PNR94445.1 hypothetical protein X926_00460 [Petrotoga sp. HWHPT.55.6.3]RPD35093.1 hypothetical protein HWHPT5561_09400 [Petrotoga sp. HWH.PT.55.6.1]